MGFRLSELGSDPHWPPEHNAQPRLPQHGSSSLVWAVLGSMCHQSVTIRPQTKVYLSGVVVQHLHFRAGTSELRAPAVCWHEVGSGSPACPPFVLSLGPLHGTGSRKKRASGNLPPGKVRQALLLLWHWQGQDKSSQAEPGQANPESRSQGTTTSQLPPGLNLLVEMLMILSWQL